MYTTVRYTAEVGTFFPKDGKPEFRESSLKVPLVGNTNIGRAYPEEQGLCDGGVFGNIDHPNKVIVSEVIRFVGRPSYNGKKLIIPNDSDGFSGRISRNHGQLRLSEGEIDFYQHLSESGMKTALWVPSDGLVEKVDQASQLMKLHFKDENKPQVDRYLLLGGQEGPSLEERFPVFSYYVMIRRNQPE